MSSPKFRKLLRGLIRVDLFNR